MKHFKFSIAWLAMLALIFTSCSKEETNSGIEDQELIEISFRSLLNDFNDQNKQATPQECREGTPAYVWVGITDAAGNYVGDGGGTSEVNLIEVSLKFNSNLGVYETHYSEELALPAGDYDLQHFIVYGADDQVLWVAPRAEGSFGDYVGAPLPQPITLEAGTKPYISVDVLCYISRDEDAYGYLFFDINLNRVENSYCVFVNYCPDDNGREVPAHFMVEVWTDGFDGDDVVILNNDRNSVDTDGTWPAASVLCFAVPDIGDGVFYARVSILDHDYYNADPAVNFVEFTFTQDDIDAQELMVPAYEHIRYNCQPPSGEPTCPPDFPLGDTNQDCVVDCKDTNTCPDDPCPGIDPELDTNGDCVIDCRDTNTCDSEGCGDTAYMFGDYILAEHYDGNNWGWGLLVDGVGADAEYQDPNNPNRWVLPFWAGAGQNDTSKAWRAGDVVLLVDGGQLHVSIELYEDVTVGDTHFWFNDEGEWPESRAPGQFDLHKDSDLLAYSFDIENDGDITLIVHAGDACHADFDND